MKRILVIDDSEVNLYLIQTIFENDKDVWVEIESESTKAVTHIQESSPDIIILDLMMPHIDGFQILEQVKNDPAMNQIPVIVISARHDKESKARCEKFGIEHYFTKPVNLDEIEKKIREIL